MYNNKDDWEIIPKFCTWAIGTLLIFLILFNKPLPAQEKLLPVFHFNQLTTDDGLPTNEIRSNVVRDKLGFVWFGTTNGLVRYDGYTCKVYRPKLNDPHSLSSNMVLSLHIDRKSRLWVGTLDGLNLYDSDHDNFIQFLPRRDDTTWLQDKIINCIYEDRLGNIWLVPQVQ